MLSTPTKKTPIQMTTQMARSSSAVVHDDSSLLPDHDVTAVGPTVRTDEPNLYNLPLDLRPTYARLPLILKASIWLCSWWIATWTTYKKPSFWLEAIMALQKRSWHVTRLPNCIMKVRQPDVLCWLCDGKLIANIADACVRVACQHYSAGHILWTVQDKQCGTDRQVLPALDIVQI